MSNIIRFFPKPHATPRRRDRSRLVEEALEADAPELREIRILGHQRPTAQLNAGYARVGLEREGSSQSV